MLCAPPRDLVGGVTKFICVADMQVDSTEEVHGQVWAVPIVCNRAPEHMRAAGLLVTEAGGNGRFRRVGFWESHEELMDDET